MKPIENLLRRRIGLDAASVGSSLIERTVRLRMKALGLTKLEDYSKLLTESKPEWDELVEAVVVTETWFFRDHDPFTAFVQLVQQEFLRDHNTAVARILSIPCSTGEEPYSLAMALLDAGTPRNRFLIDAVDLSARALERAQAALYGKNSFRGKALEFRDRHFSAVGDCFQLHEDARKNVAFHRGNLLEEAFFTGRAPYDFIFCRNLLIYFDRATQGQALRKLHRLLAPRGVLFVGPAEMPLVSEQGFVSAGLPMAFACRKSAGGNTTRITRRDVPRRPVKAAPAAPPAQPVAITLPVPAAPPAASRRAAAVPADLNAARALADAGKLSEAATICEAHVKAAGPSAQAYYLLGLVRDADGDPAALDFYRKALYLEPNHYETLLQMALLLEKNGDAHGARTFKRRAERLQARVDES